MSSSAIARRRVTRRSPPQPVMRGKRFVVIVSECNRPISEGLLAGARDALRQASVRDASIRVVWVPGAFELPAAAARIAASRAKPDAVIALGAVIRGETKQYEAIAQAAAQGLAQVAVNAVIPVTFGVVVAESAAQARARACVDRPPRSTLRGHANGGRSAGGGIRNRGADAAHAAVAMVRLFASL